jgi:hypothetical protein
MVDRTGNSLATPLRILDLSLEDAHHSVHNVTHMQYIIVDYFQVHFRFICVLLESNTGVPDEPFLPADCPIKNVELSLGLCIRFVVVEMASWSSMMRHSMLYSQIIAVVLRRESKFSIVSKSASSHSRAGH